MKKKDRSLFSDTRSLVSNWIVAEGPFTELRTRSVVHPVQSLLIPDFDRNLLVTNVMKKFSNVGSKDITETYAFSAFSERESINRTINRTLHHTKSTHLKLARKYVREYLGAFDTSVLEDVISLAYYGPGVCRGSSNCELSKTSCLTITKELVPFGPALLKESGLSRLLLSHDAEFSWLRPPIFCVDNAKLTCVPKDETKARVITVEPALNSFIQNGVGEYLRRRLERRASRFGRPYGFNLYDQSVNQSLAVYPNSTLDLKDASNSLSIALVKELLPRRWFEFLNLIRSRRYIDSEGTIRPFHLFCGMGNGFCFPLQTILFASLVRAAVEDPGNCFTVYGDDIIVSPESVPHVISLYESVGLVINRDKSHYKINDYYRESCGVHTYHGRLVTPVRFNWSQGDDFAVSVVSFHNELLKYLSRYTFVGKSSLTLLRAFHRYFPDIGIDGYGSSRISFWGNVRRRKRIVVLRPIVKPLPYPDDDSGYYFAIFRKVRPLNQSIRVDKEYTRKVPTVGPIAENEFYRTRKSYRGMMKSKVRAVIGVFPFITVESV